MKPSYTYNYKQGCAQCNECMTRTLDGTYVFVFLIIVPYPVHHLKDGSCVIHGYIFLWMLDIPTPF